MSGGGWDADPTAERARVVDLIRTAHLMMGPAVVGLLIVDSAIRDRVVVGGGLLYLVVGAVALATLTGRRLLLGLGLLDMGLIAAVASTSPATFTVLLVPAAAAVSVGWYAGPLVTGVLLGVAAVSMAIAAVMAHVPSGILAVAVMTVTGAGLARSNLRFVDDRRASVLAARELVESLPVIVWESDLRTGEVTRVMGAVEGLLGYDEHTWCTLPAGGRVHPDDLARGHWVDEVNAPPPGVPRLREFRLRRADGTFMPAREIVRVIEIDGRRVLRGVTLDVTAEADARTAVERYAAVIDHQRDPVVVVERDGNDPVVVHVNRAFGALAAAGEAREVTGRPLTEVAPWLPAALREDLAEAGRPRFERREVELATPGGVGIYDVEAISLPDGASALLLRDVTERRRAAEAIRHQAFHDALTSLPNRSLLFDRLRHALASLGRGRRSVGLLLADLDQFKEVNDTLGHAYGDRLLQTIGARLADAAREGDTVARLGGDEFAVVVADVDLEGLGVVAERIAACIREIIRLDGLDIEVGVSIGGVLAPDHGRDPHTLLQRADIAMYEAKRSGVAYRPYTPDRDPHSRERLVLMGEIRRLFTDELEVWFQPKVDLRSRRVPGVEALARWRHHRLGLLGPERFIELCEMSGAVSELTFGVLDRALAAAGGWGAEIAVNVPVRNLYDRALPARILAVLARHGVEPGRLVLEITEREIMEDHRTILEVLEELHEAGIRLSVDDFGTGYSSLTHLRRLPLTEIKIDRAFVAGMLDNENDYIIARSIVDLAHNLGHRVVAEGVEDTATATLLEQLGCDLAQGFLFARPGPAARIGPLVTCDGPLEPGGPGSTADTRADTA